MQKRGELGARSFRARKKFSKKFLTEGNEKNEKIRGRGAGKRETDAGALAARCGSGLRGGLEKNFRADGRPAIRDEPHAAIRTSDLRARRVPGRVCESGEQDASRRLERVARVRYL